MALRFTIVVAVAAAAAAFVAVSSLATAQWLDDGFLSGPTDRWCLMYRQVCVHRGTLVVFDPKSYEGSQASWDGHGWAGACPWENNVPDIVQLGRQHPADPGIRHETRIPRIEARLPTAQELAWVRAYNGSVFSKCTVPVALWTVWMSNMHEFMDRVLGWVHVMFGSNGTSPPLVDRRALLTLGTYASIPVAAWQRRLIQPFTDMPVTSYARFSSTRRPRCYEHVVLCRLWSTKFDVLPQIVRRVLLPTWAPHQPPGPVLPHANDSSVMKVIIVTREDERDARSILNLNILVSQCNSHTGWRTLLGRSTGYTRVACVVRDLGKDFYEDLTALQEADVLLLVHGSAAANSLYMRSTSSLVELRPFEFGTKHHQWPDGFMAKACEEAGQEPFCWFLNVDADGSWEPSVYEANKERFPTHSVDFPGRPGADAFCSRDRHVRLQFEWLAFMLQQVASVDRNVTLFRRLYAQGRHSFTVTANGSIEQTRHPAPP